VASKAKQRRRGTEAQHAAFTGLEGELTVNTDDWRVHVHDGILPGGHKLALQEEIGPWLDSVGYGADRLVVGGDHHLYLSLQPSGPGTAAGPKDPTAPENTDYWGSPKVSAPAADGDAVNKAYVDALGSVLGSTEALPNTLMLRNERGQCEVDSPPASAGEIATKGYVDEGDGAALTAAKAYADGAYAKAFPSSSSVNVSVPASGATFTMPFDGFAYLRGMSTGGQSSIYVGASIAAEDNASSSGVGLHVSIPAASGRTVAVAYINVTDIALSAIKAKGAV
jgi:hypothetical protein